MKGLMLHSGAVEIQREDLTNVKTPLPTESYMPIPHDVFVNLVFSELEKMGFEVTSEQHAINRGGDQYFGILRVDTKKEPVGAGVDTAALEAGLDAIYPVGGNEVVPVKKDFQWIAGLRNSHDKSYPAGLLFGSEVFICDNLAFSGEIQIMRRHTVHIMRDLPMLTDRAVGMLTDKWGLQDKRFELYKGSEVTPVNVHDMMIRALDNGVIGSTSIPKILQEYRHPSYQEFAEHENVWRLFNAFTTIFKTTSLFNLPKRTQALTGLLDGFVGLTVTKPGTEEVEDGVIQIN